MTQLPVYKCKLDDSITSSPDLVWGGILHPPFSNELYLQRVTRYNRFNLLLCYLMGTFCLDVGLSEEISLYPLVVVIALTAHTYLEAGAMDIYEGNTIIFTPTSFDNYKQLYVQCTQ